MKKLIFTSVICILAACGKTDVNILENEYIRFEFSKDNGALVSLYNINEGVEHIDSATAAVLPIWDFEYMPGYAEADNIPTEVMFTKKGKDCLEIVWRQKKNVNGPELKATIRIKKDRPSLADWKIQAKNIEGLGVKAIHFPMVHGIKPQGENDELALGVYTGRLYRNPWSIVSDDNPLVIRRETGYQAMQVNVLYNPYSDGLYWGTEDTDAWYKTYNLEVYPDRAQFQISHFLRLDIDKDSYCTPYPVVIGVFKGDWIDAAQLYGQWGRKQKWCTESRLKKGLVPEWVLNTALWEWNRGRSVNVLPEAVALQKHIGLPVSVFWHWWHNCSYDEGFPDYLPPREGREAFIDAVAQARKEGIHCINYMNSYKWGDSDPSWKERNAERWCIRKDNGGTISKVYNIFTGNSLTCMCTATEFWRKTYTDMCDTLVNVYGTGGIYLDQSCQAKPCYSTSHGHSVGGGNFFIKGHLQMMDEIREALVSYPYDKPALGGEYASEFWMRHLDIGLPLQAGDERMGGNTYEIIPFFPSVYHEYQVCYGNFSMLVSPPYDEKWPAEFRPKDTETLLPDEYDRQFMMEQARTFVWGIQPCIANFHKHLIENKPEAMGFLTDMVKTRYQALDFLLYGTFVRCPEFPAYEEEIPICKLATYVTSGSRLTASTRKVPTLYSSAWKAQDGSIGIAIANIADEARDIQFSLDPAFYGLTSHGKITLVTSDSEPEIIQEYDGVTPVNIHIQERSTAVIVIR